MGVGKDGEGGEGRGPVVCPPGQRIRLPISCAPPVDDAVVVGREGGRSPGVPPRRSACRAKVLEVFMVGVDADMGLCSLQVDPPLLERLHDCKQLLGVDGIVEFGRIELPGVVADWVQIAIGVFLGQDAAQGEVGRVRLHCDELSGWKCCKIGAEVKAR